MQLSEIKKMTINLKWNKHVEELLTPVQQCKFCPNLVLVKAVSVTIVYNSLALMNAS